ncbi:MAG TPA: SCO family protein [Blastocatellia bacterium]|nr:SCO family protein [Blastocatellia bacterium]
MPDLSRRNLLGLMGMAPLAGAALLKGGAVLGATDSTRSNGPVVVTPAETQAARERIRQRYFPDVTLYTQDNKPVRFYQDLVKDKIVTINFFYSKCENICPLVMANMVKVQKLLGGLVGKKLFMNSITLTPGEDTPAALKEYQKMFGIGPGWNLLTGKPDDIEHLRKSLGFTYPNKLLDQDREQHIGNVRYGNEPLMLWSACPGMAHAKWVAESIQWVIRS